MKKTFKAFLSLILVCFASVIVAGCGPKLKSLSYVEGSMDTTLFIGEELNYTGFQAKATFNNDTITTIYEEDVEFNDDNVDLTKAGTTTLEYSYKGMTDEIEISVIDPTADIKSVTYTGSIPTTLNIGQDLDLSGFSAKVVYEGDIEVTVHASDVTFNTNDIDWTTEGTKELTFTFGGITKSIYIEVVLSTEIESFRSLIVDEFDDNKDDFSLKQSPYHVGDDNDFDFRIEALAYDEDSEQISITNPAVTMEIYKSNGSSYGNKLSNSEIATYFDNYSDINATRTNKLNFSSAAIGQTFKVKVTTKYYSEILDEENRSFELENIQVVDGYNIYDARGLSLLDNSTAETNEYYGWDKENLKTPEELALSNQIKGLVMHKTIKVERKDLPSTLFWSESETKPSIQTNLPIVGSLKDDPVLNLYQRDLTSDFTFYGNYFQVDATSVPRVVVTTVGDDNGIMTGGEKENPIISHSNLMWFKPKTHYANNTADNYYDVNFENVALVGNGRRNPSAVESGGLILMKAQGIDLLVKNCSYIDFYIGFFTNKYDNVSTSAEDHGKYTFLNTIGDNCYNSLMYIWGAKETIIENCSLTRAGGPALIIDHAHGEDTNAVDNEGEDNDIPATDYVSSFPSDVKIINSTVQSYVTGNEGWFASLPGAEDLIANLQSASGLFALKGFTRSIQTDIPNDDVEDLVFNLVCAYKSSQVQGPSEYEVKGKVSISHDHDGDPTTPEVLYNKPLDLNGFDPTNLSGVAIASGDMFFEAHNDEGKFISVGGLMGFNPYKTAVDGDGNPDGSHLAGKYVNVYLPNGMGAIFEVFPVSAQN